MASDVYLVEIFPPNFRAMVVIALCMMYIVSCFFLTSFAYIFVLWRQIQLYVPMTCGIGLLLLYFLPRSPRWLLVNNRKDDARHVLSQIASMNRIVLDGIDVDLPSSCENEQDQQKYTYRHLLQNMRIAVLTIVLGSVWFTISLAYYTLSFEASNLGGSIYQAFLFTMLAEVPSMFAAYYLCDKVGRKKTTLFSLTMTGVFGACIVLVPKHSSVRYILNIVFAMTGKFFAEITFQGIYVWTFELYPTVVRMQGVALGIFFERAGSFGAPFLTSVLHPINASLPYIILLCCAIVSSIVSWFVLDETMNQPTRERFEDIFKSSPMKTIEKRTAGIVHILDSI